METVAHVRVRSIVETMQAAAPGGQICARVLKDWWWFRRISKKRAPTRSAVVLCCI